MMSKPLSLMQQREQQEFESRQKGQKRARSQVGRNGLDEAKMQAIKAHFGQVSNEFLYGVVREDDLRTRVSDDWDAKSMSGKQKFPQGYWPQILKLYRSPAVDADKPPV